MSALIKYLIIRCLSEDLENLSFLAQLRFLVHDETSQLAAGRCISSRGEGRAAQSPTDPRQHCWAAAAGTDGAVVKERSEEGLSCWYPRQSCWGGVWEEGWRKGRRMGKRRGTQHPGWVQSANNWKPVTPDTTPLTLINTPGHERLN